jgi:hypothetical protein
MPRDDFSSKTKDILGKRVGFICSNPVCRKHTIGPNSNPDKATIIGEAAHITAASVGGPRYDPSLDEIGRQSILNGIWLCSNCSDLIDKDEKVYTVELLVNWKQQAENEMGLKINGVVEHRLKPNLDIDLIWQFGGRSPNGYSPKNKYEYLKDENAYRLLTYPPIIFWRLYWNFKLTIYNNSTIPVFNLQVHEQDDLKFDYLTLPPKKNNLPSLQNIDLEAKSYQGIESSHVEADELMRQKIPIHLEGLKIQLSYSDEKNNRYIDTFDIRNSQLVKIRNSS